jgi:integrase
MRLKSFSGWWYAVWTENGKTRRLSLRTQDREAAFRALTDLKRAPPGTTVAEIYTAYLADKGTERARFAWKQLAEPFGAFRPNQVTRLACRDYASMRRAKKVSDGTIHTELTYLRAAMNWHDRTSPAIIELPSKPPPADRYLTRKDYIRLLNAAETKHVKLFIMLALTTAGRMTAILELTWDRVDFERCQIALGTGERRVKGRATVPMVPSVHAALKEAFAERECDRVISYGGKPVSRVRVSLARVAQAAGVPWVTPHVFRHTAAVWMAEDGRPMSEIAQVLGHTDSRITERVYSRLSPGYLRTTVASLEVSQTELG